MMLPDDQAKARAFLAVHYGWRVRLLRLVVDLDTDGLVAETVNMCQLVAEGNQASPKQWRELRERINARRRTLSLYDEHAQALLAAEWATEHPIYCHGSEYVAMEVANALHGKGGHDAMEEALWR